MKTSIIFTFSDLCSQGIELLGGRLARVPCGRQLPFTYGVHSFYSSDRTPRRPKRLEPQHRPRASFHCAMVLLHDVIQIFGVASDDGGLVRAVVARDRCGVAPTLINGDFLRQPLRANGLM